MYKAMYLAETKIQSQVHGACLLTYVYLIEYIKQIEYNKLHTLVCCFCCPPKHHTFLRVI